ncbi:MAG TPA: SBBP repeat-containing protein, partial [Candidatus Binatia bacterium]|nr:SBBP repeat-containing protein [Candidatus Binatia bacterium]
MKRSTNWSLQRLALGVHVCAIGLFAQDPASLFADNNPRPVITSSSRPTPRRAMAAPLGRDRFPLYFIENRGQLDAHASYYIHGADKMLYFGSHGVTMVLSKAVQGQSDQASLARVSAASEKTYDGSAPQTALRTAVTLEFVGANPSVKPIGEELAPPRFSYFKGPREHWTVGLRSYNKLVYSDLWPGIDLIYTTSVDRLKYAFVVKPGADPSSIKLRYRGAESVSLTNEGKLSVRTVIEDFYDEKPSAHQEIAGRFVDIDVDYVLLSSPDGGQAYGFNIGAYDSTKVVVIDPAILVYAGFIGGAGDDRGNAIAVDAEGNAYVTGETNSLETSFPVAGGLDASQNGGVDAFVAKIDPSGTQLLYAGFIGGAGDDRGKAIAVDPLGNAYITGETDSAQTSFPITNGPDQIHNGQLDAFVAKINSDGTDLIYAGYLGGVGNDRGTGVAIDSSNRAYVTGETNSTGASFPAGAGFGALSSFDASHNGSVDAFVARVTANGASLEYAGYIGGIGSDRGTSIAVDNLNRAYITGETDSGGGSFPNGAGFGGLTSFDSTQNGGSDAFVARVAANGQTLEYAGYIGGSAADKGNGITVDGGNNAYVTGETRSDENSFPDGNGFGELSGPGQTQKGGVDAFVAKIGPAGTSLVYAGYFGGSDDDRGNSIALMPGCVSNCEVYITGETNSTKSSFAFSIGFDLILNGGFDAFLAQIEADGSLGTARTFGGSDDDRGRGVALDTIGGVYVTGETSSTRRFPVKGSLDRRHNLGVDAFVAKFCVS